MKNIPTRVRTLNNALTLRAKLIIAFVALALLPIVSIGYYADFVTRGLINKSTQQDLTKASNQTALQIDAYIVGQMDSIRTEAQQPFLGDYLELALSARVGSIQELNARQILVIFSRKDPIFIKSYALVERHGFNLLDTDETQIGDYEGDFDYFKESFTSGLPFASSIYFQKENRQYRITCYSVFKTSLCPVKKAKNALEFVSLTFAKSIDKFFNSKLCSIAKIVFISARR